MAAFLLFLIGASGCQRSGSVRVLKLAHGLDTNHPVHKAMVYMGERLAEISGGKMKVDIYPSGQLGSERELVELLQIGTLAMTKVSTSPLEGFIPQMKVFSLPYVFNDVDHLWKVLQGDIGREMLLAGTPYRLRGMCYYDAGARSFYTKDRPIMTPSDLQGMKIRVQKSITSVKLVQALGGSATPVAWGEIYTALQQGVVDGAENNPPSFHTSRHYEVCKYYSLDEHTYPPDILLMSEPVWESLTPQEQEWVQQAVDESVVYQRTLWAEATQLALEEVQAAGVEVLYPDKTPFQEAVKPLYEEYRNTDLFDLIERIKHVAEEE